MQKTRQQIIDYLMKNGEATVDELSEALDNLTAVTVRHHLDVLRSEELVSDPEPQHRSSPGRPRYVYRLTEKADSLFPGNLNALTTHIIGELQSTLEDDQINVIFDGVAGRMASEFDGVSDEPLSARLDRVVIHLTGHGYEAYWEGHPEGYVLHTSHCPYGEVAEAHDSLCKLDIRYISRLLGHVPRRMSHIAEGDHACSYLIIEGEGAFEAAG